MARSNFHQLWDAAKGKERIGRLVPLYITRIQQRYALYLHRKGTPCTPWEAVLTTEERAEKEEEIKNGKEVSK